MSETLAIHGGEKAVKTKLPLWPQFSDKAIQEVEAVLGIGLGDEVIVPSYTFIASSFSVVQAGAIPRFADVNLEDHYRAGVPGGERVGASTRRRRAWITAGWNCPMRRTLARQVI